ncbi:MAG: hypothetical protein AVDCRST_MAG04-1832, partial [uncultured Acetobacteraceae bacterium]
EPRHERAWRVAAPRSGRGAALAGPRGRALRRGARRPRAVASAGDPDLADLRAGGAEGGALRRGRRAAAARRGAGVRGVARRVVARPG